MFQYSYWLFVPVDMELYRLNRLGYEGRIEVANSLDEIIALIAEFSHEDELFIGGNGQEAIIEIQERIRLLSENLEFVFIRIKIYKYNSIYKV